MSLTTPVDVQSVSAEEMEMSLSGPAVYVNKFIVNISSSGTRITFAEHSPETPPVFRAAVLISIPDTFALAGLLKELLDKNVTVTPGPAPEMPKGE